jgi:hypothetical protein
MRRTVRLTERDLSRLVRRVIREGITEEIGAVPLSQVKDGTKGTYYVQNGKLIINDGTMSMEVTAG